MSKPEGVEPIIKLMAALIVFFTLVLIFCEYVFPQDGQVFQVFCGILTGITGAILIRVKPSRNEGDGNAPIIDSKVTASQKE